MRNGCRLSRKAVTPTKAFKDLVDYGDIKRSGLSMRLKAIKSEFEELEKDRCLKSESRILEFQISGT